MTDIEAREYFLVVWDGAHGHQDRDLLSPVDWNDPKSPLEIVTATGYYITPRRDVASPLLKVLTEFWQDVPTIAKLAGLSREDVRDGCWRLAHKGILERGERTYWRTRGRMKTARMYRLRSASHEILPESMPDRIGG